MDLFFADSKTDTSIDYNELIRRINDCKIIENYCRPPNQLSLFVSLIVSMLYQKNITLIDPDFSISELKNIGLNFDEATSFQVDEKKISSKLELISRLRTSTDWKVTLFTSGTTGIPKKVTHTFGTISRGTRISDKFANNVWGFAYNPTHIAGLQVFLQAILNGNSIINLFNLDRFNIFESIRKYSITHISATPTFYRFLLGVNDSFESVKRITFGGEKFDLSLGEKLKKIFPNARQLNVFASTELGSLFASEGNIFTINKNKELIKILNDELVVHKSLMGINSEDIIDGDWYYTGDMVKKLHTDSLSFVFIGRKNEMINIGGDKVNGSEVEEIIRTHPHIVDVRVFGKPNSVLGNILCCEVVAINDLDEKLLKLFLTDKLQNHKIPRIIKFVEKLDLTRTGKIAR